MNPEEQFTLERLQRLEEYSEDARLKSLAHDWVFHSMQQKYLYNFDWLGRPIIQYPEDMVAIQELIWKVKPTLVIETGIAHGGSLVLSASMLAMLDYCEAAELGKTLDPRKSLRRVVGIDIDIRSHNRLAIEAHPLSGLISMVEGSSVDRGVIDEVHRLAVGHETVMVFMDSNHTHEHVLGELSAWVNDGDRDLIVNARSDIEWLISEVERLRDIEAAAFMKGHDHGRDIERGFTTAWLRRGDACCVENADRIARGEHRGEDK
jgi:cephalosporin hydroxylase